MKCRYARRSDYPFIIRGLEDVRRKSGWRNAKITLGDRKDIRKAIVNHSIRIAEEKGKPIAFIDFFNDSEMMYFKKKYLWVDVVFVDKQYRNNGIGHKLYRDVARIAGRRGISNIVTDVFDPNKGSVRFHERLGFRPLYTTYQKKL